MKKRDGMTEVHVMVDGKVWKQARKASQNGSGSLSQIVERSLRKELAEVTVSNQKIEQESE